MKDYEKIARDYSMAIREEAKKLGFSEELNENAKDMEKPQLTIKLMGSENNLYVNAQGIKVSKCAEVVGYAIRILAEENAKLHDEEVTSDYLVFVASQFAEALFDGDFNVDEMMGDRS